MQRDKRSTESFLTADYLTKLVVKGKSSTTVPVHEVMTPAQRLMTVTPNHSVLEVMEMMNDNNFRHVPVVRLLALLCMQIERLLGDAALPWTAATPHLTFSILC